MGKGIVFFVLFVISGIFLLALLINGARLGIRVVSHKECLHISSVVKKNAVILMSLFGLMVIVVSISQLTASTPRITVNQGAAMEGSIAELRKVTLNGHEEWITIRGESRSAPILLFLAGGPGGTQMAATRYELAELEKHFVVVNWDQPGSGKSYNCMNRSKITVQTYVEDGSSLVKYLLEQFGQEKLYVMGESWGSALGIFLIAENPENYAGFIGTGQMVDFKETEILDYNKAIEIAKSKGDNEFVQKMIDQGEPPYYEGNIALESAGYLNYLSTYMSADPNITNGGYHTFRDMFAQEYGIWDSIHYMLGVMNTFNVVYPTLYETDLRVDYTKLEVPTYFFIGRYDLNAPTSLVEDYYKRLEVPKKELVWFEHSGHSPWLNETDLFIEETLRVFEK